MENTIEIYASDITPFDDDDDFITAAPAAQIGAETPVKEILDEIKNAPYDSSHNTKNTAAPVDATSTFAIVSPASGGSQDGSNSCMKNLHVDGTSTAADESPRLLIDRLIARGNVTQTEIDDFTDYLQSVRNALPTPSNSAESEKKLNNILYYIVNNGNSGIWNDWGIENFNSLCETLHISADITVGESADKKSKHYHGWKISLTDWLKIVRYVDKLKLPQSTEMSLNFTPMSDAQFNNVISGNNTSSASPVPVCEIDAAYINRYCDIWVVANHYLTPAEQNTFVCPKCGSGSHGNHNTGMPIDKSRNKIHCFNCGIDWSALDVILHCENLSDRGKDFVDALKIACNLYDLPFDDNRADFDPLPPEKIPEKRTQEEIKLAIADIAESPKNIEKLPVAERRGLSLETFKHFGVGFIADYIYPSNRITGKRVKVTPRLIIPTSDITYNAILLKSARTGARYEKKSLNAGSKYIFNLKAITKGKPVIVVEGEIDAMSIWQACKGDINVIASGGAAQSNLIRYFDKIRADYQFVILFDNDETGLSKSQKLADGLIKKGYPAVCKFLADGESKIDANDILITQGDAALKTRIDEIISTAMPELAAVKESIMQANLLKCTRSVPDDPRSVPASVPDDLKLTDAQRNFLFSGTLTDLINARRIAYLFKADLRYLTDADKWLTFGGQCWNIATNSNNTGVYSYAAKLADILRANAKSKEDFALVKVFENLRTVNPALNYLKGVESIRITRKDLNTHKNLLNCQNGVVDLETKKIYPQSPDLLLTQMVKADYRPAFYSDIVGNYFGSVMPDESTLAALLRYLGYGLTGEIIEHKALFIHGGGRNGKGTLTQFLLKLLGDYATSFPIRAVLAKYQSRDADAPTPAFSKLEFKRLAIAEEIPAGEKLDSAQFKILTGGDQLPIRHLHEEAAAIENPTQKMIFSGNNLPELDDTRDLGLVERFMVIKFTQTFIGANRDLNLQKKLFTPDALSGFLTLLVDNAAEWYKDGLIDSVAMESAKNEYLREQDFILDFIDENCVVKDVAIIRFTEFLEKLRKEYSMARTMSDRALSTAVAKTLATIKGVEKRKAHGLYKIFGLGWKVDDEFAPVISDDFIDEPIPDDQIPVKF